MSCSQVNPELISVESEIIFEFSQGETLPEARLAVFAQTESNPRRFESIRIKILDSDLEWTTEEITCLQSGKNLYAGNVNFVMPENREIPVAQYQITFIQADGEEVSKLCQLTYPTEIYKMNKDKCVDFLSSFDMENKILIFDENRKVIFYGEKTAELNTARNIWTNFSNASTFREVLYLPKEKVMCILPVEKIFETK